MYPIAEGLLLALATGGAILAATLVWLLRGRDCGWYKVLAIGLMGGVGGALCAMFVGGMSGSARSMRPVFIAAAVTAAVIQYFHDYEHPR